MASKRSSLGLHFLSTRHRLELQELFDGFDHDKDGKVTPQDLEEMLQSAGITDPTAVSSMLKGVQTDENGNLSFAEFARIMRPTLSNPHRLTKKQQELKEAFDAFDHDGDGVINATELYAMMEKLGDKVSKEEANRMIQEADKDKDGVIDFNEFSVMMGVQPPETPASPTSPSCEKHHHHHHHHRYSVRRFFCKHHKNDSIGE